MPETKKQASADISATHLMIVESPSKIKTISKFLDKSYKIVSTSGHIKDLPEKEIGVKIVDETLQIDYVPLKGKGVTISNICKEAKNCSEILLASDPDREGEIIAQHIGEEISKATKGKAKIFRIVFNEITKPAIQEAIKNKHDIDQKKVSAQQARRILDRWVGYEVSPILWKTVAKGTSAGRVQSVAVLFICDREEEILKFIPEESWSITASLSYEKNTIESQLFKIKNKAINLKNETSTQKVLKDLEQCVFEIKEINDKQRTKNPQAPFITSSLQQDAYNKLGFSVDKTMTIAQKLYEGVMIDGAQEALITYMRTDSTRLSETALTEIKDFIKNKLGNDFLPKKSSSYAKGGAQDAHEAIRPISVYKTPESLKNFLEPDFQKLYDLIWRRTLACEMAPAIFAQRQVLISAGENYLFKTTGSTPIFEGFLKIYKPEENDEEEKSSKIPEIINKGQIWKNDKLASKQHFTEPPPRYNEASMVKELKERGIGRPSTYATILTTIQKRKYVEKQNKRFYPTEFGKTIVKILVENLADIFNPFFTAKMEEDLDKIASGETTRDTVLFEFYKKFKKDLDKFVKTTKEGVAAKFIATEINCKACNEHNLIIRFSKNGEFLACPGFPKCTFTSQFQRTENGEIKLLEKSEKKELEEQCPNCGKKLVEKIGRYGKFAACPGYPECKFILKNK